MIIYQQLIAANILNVMDVCNLILFVLGAFNLIDGLKISLDNMLSVCILVQYSLCFSQKDMTSDDI